MKPVPFLLATCALASAPIYAAPATATPPINPVTPAQPAKAAPPAKPAGEVAPLAPQAALQFDAAAVTLMEQSVKAYAALDALSQKFEILDKIDGAVQPRGSGRGTLRIQKPGNARLEVNVGDKSMLYLSDGENLVSQTVPTSYQKSAVSGDMISRVAAAIPSAANVPLSMLLGGKNPLGGSIKWQKATLTSFEGMKGVAMELSMRAGSEPVIIQVYLDPKTNLVARIEAAGAVPKKADEAPSLYSNVTTFVADTTPITPAIFEFVPAPGVTLVQQAERPKTYDEKLVVGAKPFALSQKDLDGKPFSLDSYKGKVVLLDFWATWCGPCIGELPNVKANYDKYKADGFDIVGVSLDEDEEALRNFIKAKEMPWAQLFDAKGWANADAKTYGVQAIPFTLLIGKDGNIAAVNPRGEALEPAIKAALTK